MADPKDADQTEVVVGQLSKEADQAMRKALITHGVPEHIINKFIQNY